MSADNLTPDIQENGTGKLDRYPGIRPFSKGQSMLFYGRNAELNELLNSVKAYSLFVLHSKSGLGKTSLLNAGLMPMLEKEGFLPIEIRFRFTNISKDDTIEIPDPFKVIEEACKAVTVETAIAAIKPEYKTLWIYLKLLKDRHKTPVLVFDQFEEFFSHPDKSRKEQIIMQFAELLNDKPPVYVFDFIRDHKDLVGDDEAFFLESCPARILFSIRSDKLALLDEMKTLIPSITNKRFQLNPLFAAQAKQAILLPATLINFSNHTFRKSPFEYDDKALETILKVLQDKTNAAEIESTQLQIICQSIEKKIPDAGNGTIEEITEDSFGGEDGLRRILKNFYDDQLAALSEMKDITFYDMERVRDMIETKMLFEEMRVGLLKKQVINSLSDVETLNDENERVKKAEFIISALIDLRIIRSEETYLGVTYIITHDTLIRPIIESHKQDIDKKEQTALRSFADVTKMIANFNQANSDDVIEFFAKKMVAGSERVQLAGTEIVSALSAFITDVQATRMLSYGTRKNFFRPGQKDNKICYQLSNDRLVDLVEKEYTTRKTIRDNKRLKEEKEKLEKLTAEKEQAEKNNRRLSTIIGIVLLALFVGAVIALIYFKRQSDANETVLAKNLNYEADRKYAEGYQVLAYALWKQARTYAPEDTVIQKNLNDHEYAPYAGSDIEVSAAQDYVGTLNGNTLNVWRDDKNQTRLAGAVKNVHRFSFLPQSNTIYLQDTAEKVQIIDPVTWKNIRMESADFSLDSFTARRSGSNVKISAFAIRFMVGQNDELSYFFTPTGKYLANISNLCNKADSFERVSTAGENTALLQNGTRFFLLDASEDAVIPLGKFDLPLRKIVELSKSRYCIRTGNPERTKTQVLVVDVPTKKIIYRSKVLNGPWPIVTTRRVITQTGKRLEIFDYTNSTTSFTFLPPVNSGWVSLEPVGDDVNFVNLDPGPVTQIHVFRLFSNAGHDLKHIPVPDTIVNTADDFMTLNDQLIYRTAKGTLYLYDTKTAAPKVLAKGVSGFSLSRNNLLRVASSTEDYLYINIFTLQQFRSVPTMYELPLLPPKFFQSTVEDKLVYIDSTKNNVDSLAKRYEKFINDRFHDLGLPEHTLQKLIRKRK